MKNVNLTWISHVLISILNDVQWDKIAILIWNSFSDIFAKIKYENRIEASSFDLGQ